MQCVRRSCSAAMLMCGCVCTFPQRAQNVSLCRSRSACAASRDAPTKGHSEEAANSTRSNVRVRPAIHLPPQNNPPPLLSLSLFRLFDFFQSMKRERDVEIEKKKPVCHRLRLQGNVLQMSDIERARVHPSSSVTRAELPLRKLLGGHFSQTIQRTWVS